MKHLDSSFIVCLPAIVAVVSGFGVQMAPRLQVVVGEAAGEVLPAFAPGATAATAFTDDDLSSIARFVVQTGPREFYNAPRLACAGCTAGVSAAHIDMSDGGVAEVGNVDPDRLCDFFTDGSLLEVSVFYECAGAAADVVLNLSFPMAEAPAATDADMERLQAEVDAGEPVPAFKPTGKVVTFSWRKRCPQSGTIHRGFVASLDGTAVVNEGAPVVPSFDVASPTFVVPPEATSTEFRIAASAGSFCFDRPTVTSSSAAVAVRATGTAALPGFAYSDVDVDDATLVLFYERCDASEKKATITVRWAIPPYAPIQFSFIKECGGGDAPGFTVSMATPQGTQVAVSNGRATHDFVDGRTMFGPASDATTFWISAAEKPVTVLRVTLSQNPHAIFKSTLTGDLASIGPGGFALAAKEESTLMLSMKCEKAGTSHVTTSFQIDRHKSVDVTFSKQCKAPAPAKKDKGGWTTLSVVIVITAVVFIIGSILMCLRESASKKRPRPKVVKDQDL